MRKEFNDTGLCIPERHFMVDTLPKLNRVMDLIDRGKYFTMNRPRQFGKTTTANLLYHRLLKDQEYIVILMSLEDAKDDMLENQSVFIQGILNLTQNVLKSQSEELALLLDQNSHEVNGFDSLGQMLSKFVEKQDKKVVLIIDEVDKWSHHTFFQHFLGLFRNFYMLRETGMAKFLLSVILVSVHDIKNLKPKACNEEIPSYNIPWNIAVDFTIDLAFSAEEIQTMLRQYAEETQTQMNIPEIAERIFYYTSGYPYLVSKMCKVMDEVLAPQQTKWTLEEVEASFKYLVQPDYKTTLFDDLAKNLNNNEDLYDLVFDIVINGEKRTFNIDSPLVSLADTYGILKPNQEKFCQVHNRIFEQRIYNYMLANQEQKKQDTIIRKSLFEDEQEGLNLKEALLSFQAFMKENYATKDEVFLERQGRLLFMSFLKPVLNGKGFDFKEPVVGDERRTDIVITYLKHRYVVELKRWQGEKYHQRGLKQLSNYLDLYGLKEGFLLIYDFRKEKEYKQEQIQFEDKNIFAVWV